jgi:hypothetical protein
MAVLSEIFLNKKYISDMEAVEQSAAKIVNASGFPEPRTKGMTKK